MMKFLRVNDRLIKIIDCSSAEGGKYIFRAIYSNPFTEIYSVLLVLYVFILAGSLLWPFDFTAWLRNDARWTENPKGIELQKMGQAVSNSSTQEFFERLVKGKGLTLELWLKTDDLNQSGPARILSYSIDAGSRNFTIGQSQDNLVVRLRTTETDRNGIKPHLIIEKAFKDRSPHHIVIMYNFSEQIVYIDGEQKVRSEILKGNFSNWDPACKLVFGNEATGNKPWKGKIYYAAVYDKSLTEQEIQHNYILGFRLKTDKGNTKHTGFKENRPVSRYLLNEGKGDVIHDSGFLSKPVNLFMPKYIKRKNAPFLAASHGYLKKKWQDWDLIIHILIFTPLGILICGTLKTRHGITLKTFLAILLAGTVCAIGFESLQHFSMTRNSSIIDAAANMTGIAIGIVLARFFDLFLNYQATRLQMQMYDHRKPYPP